MLQDGPEVVTLAHAAGDAAQDHRTPVFVLAEHLPPQRLGVRAQHKLAVLLKGKPPGLLRHPLLQRGTAELGQHEQFPGALARLPGVAGAQEL